MIQAVIFDWGGVLMRTADPGPRSSWDARLGLSAGSVNRLVFESGDWRRAQLGQISEDEVWSNLAARLGLAPATRAKLRHDFWAGDQLDAELMAFIRDLRLRFKTALLSNFPASLRALLMQCDAADAFDVMVISGEVGLVKPDARIYQLAAERLAVPLGECLFVDDLAENVAGARAAGMQGLHFAPKDTASAELRRLTAVTLKV